jgi:hypothetical protein
VSKHIDQVKFSLLKSPIGRPPKLLEARTICAYRKHIQTPARSLTLTVEKPLAIFFFSSYKPKKKRDHTRDTISVYFTIEGGVERV